jgi:hypothetical protein
MTHLGPLVFALVGVCSAQTLSLEERETFIDFECSKVIGSTEVEVRRRFGNPKKISREKVPNRHVEGQIDEIVTLIYKGLAIRFYKIPEREILVYASIRDPRIRLPHGLVVGGPVSRVVSLLGAPEKNQ